MYFRVSGVLSNRGLTDGIPQAAERRTQPATGPHYVRKGSTTEVSDGHENVRSWVTSGSRIWAAGGLLVAISRLTPISNGNRILADRDAGGGSRLQHQKLTDGWTGRYGVTDARDLPCAKA